MIDPSGPGGSVLPLREHLSLQDENVATLVFRVNNFGHLAAAYSANLADDVMNVIAHTLAELLNGHGSTTVARDLVSVLLPDVSALGQGTGQIGCQRLACDLVSALTKRPIVVRGRPVHASISAGWVSAANDGPSSSTGKDADLHGILGNSDLAGSPLHTRPLHTRNVAIVRYIRDMELSAALLADLEDGNIQLAWQPIRCANSSADILYHECFLKVFREGIRTPPIEDISALERLGLVRVLDQHILNFVIGELQDTSTPCLAVNISAQSARLDEWWCRTLELLGQQRDVARRLVIEIGQTAPISDIESAIKFIQKMRSLGVRVALDGFGAGYASVRQILALKPDIVKLDALFMRHALEPGPGRETFCHLAGLAGNLAPLVIATGIESPGEWKVATNAGVNWQQGHYHGGPTNIRVWRVVQSPDALARCSVRVV